MNPARSLRTALRARRVFDRVRSFTLLPAERIRGLYKLLATVEADRIPGDVVECGVYHGGSAAALADIATHSPLPRTLWLFDSFQGMPVPAREKDGDAAFQYAGELVGSPEIVRQALRCVGANVERVRIVPGWFHETFPAVEIPQVAFLFVDCDWYDSVKLCLETFYAAVVPDGIISFDDYGYWPGCKRAVDHFLAERRIAAKLKPIDSAARWFRKPKNAPN